LNVRRIESNNAILMKVDELAMVAYGLIFIYMRYIRTTTIRK
jgi:hypothetical protein